MQTKNKWLMGGAASALLLVLAWAFAPRPQAVEIASAQAGRFELGIEEDAKTRVQERYLVSAPLAGRWLRPQLKEGDAVQAGAVLGVLQPTLAALTDARSRAELAARAEAASDAVHAATARLAAVGIAQAQAQQELSRSEALARQGYLSAARRDSDALALQAAQQNLKAAQSELKIAQHEAAQARAALGVYGGAGGAGAAGNGFVLRAPVAGQVLRVQQPSEGVVALGAPLLELGDTAQLEVVAELLSTDALAVRPGQPVQIERWGGPAVLKGQVLRVEPGAFTKVSALGVEEQRVRVLVKLLSPPAERQQLGDGYRVGVRILTRSAEGALLVPVSAVFPLPRAAAGRHAVFRVEGGRARLTEVKLEARNGAVAWVTGGLDAGSQVVSYPPQDLQDGARVKPR
ncbi:HlyD family efflux transporter periplasmic adaptor subunit [Paucibacter sediminis]|uniref:HlyD family efflux transporter periplasmic adaptor subunit n=1 Tax=Paucibacter sediminis TaxID=3019553 RepID=A0AA95N811_9BURK|nr:HlyD family efflux transporter periplasmic adaptor subunit [Paucibacter sp. S2-9]WIT10092.1 HlyD family efflux transporter periplasmic adaptor subunit [Paucibacter sp. S2-9]